MNLAAAFMFSAHRSFSKKAKEIEGFANSYWAWNLSSIAASRKATVEFRLPPGVLNAHDALAWMNLVAAFMFAASGGDSRPASLDTFISKALDDYIGVPRKNKFPILPELEREEKQKRIRERTNLVRLRKPPTIRLALSTTSVVAVEILHKGSIYLDTCVQFHKANTSQRVQQYCHPCRTFGQTNIWSLPDANQKLFC